LSYLFPPAEVVSLEIAGSDSRFPVRRIYCVGSNYAEHIVEMGGDPDRLRPFFFGKPLSAIVSDGSSIAYPSATENLHHEVELVIALSQPADHVAREQALDCVYGFGVGIDMTRRDLQAQAKKAGQPWETGKAFEASAPLSAIMPRAQCGDLATGEIALSVNGQQRQCGDLGQMIWKVDEIVAELSRFFPLYPGDLIFTGTPAGVGPVVVGDEMQASIAGVGSLHIRVTEAVSKLPRH